MGRIKQMKKMVARLPGPIIINLRSGDFFFWQVKLLFATILDCLPTTPTLLDIPPPPRPLFPIQRSSPNFYKFTVFACGGATVIPNMLKQHDWQIS